MSSPAWEPRALTAGEIDQAKRLFVAHIPLVVPGALDDPRGQVRRVRRWMESTGAPAPADAWIGVVDQGRVIGALHASPHYGQAADILNDLGRNAHAPGPDWLRTYVEKVGSLEEVAVEPTHRRRGVAATLVRAAVRELAQRDCRTLSGFASDLASARFFRKQGFTVGEHHQTVPPEIALGLRTGWWDAAPDEGRFFWRVLPAPGDAFGLPFGARG